jgi:UDP-N-acetylmuramoyl-L-alanyl-D-glutamate--2,6-diaminopimelate ligase
MTAALTMYQIIEDRRIAIKTAIDLAEESDVVVIAGKGHEDYQIIGETKIHLDDREEARAWIKDKISNNEKKDGKQ